MGRYRVTPGSSSFNSSSRDTRPKLSSGNLTLLETISYRARNDALTSGDRDKLKSLISALGYKKDRLPIEHQDKIRRTQSAVSASMQRVAAKQAKQQASAKADGPEKTPEYMAKVRLASALNEFRKVPDVMNMRLNGYTETSNYRGLTRFHPVEGSPSKALDVLIKDLPRLAEKALETARSFTSTYGDFHGRTLEELEKDIRSSQSEFYDSMKKTLLPHLDAEQIASLGLPAATSQREAIDFKSTAKAEFTVPPRPMR